MREASDGERWNLVTDTPSSVSVDALLTAIRCPSSVVVVYSDAGLNVEFEMVAFAGVSEMKESNAKSEANRNRSLERVSVPERERRDEGGEEE